MDFRAVCSSWRSATRDAKNNLDEPFRPSQWILIDEVTNSRDVKSRTRLLVNTATGRTLRKDLPFLPGYYVVVTGPNGFFVLADREPPHAACILNPFTGYLLRFMAPMVTEAVHSAAIYGPAASPTLILFCDSRRKLYTAKTDSECFAESEDNYDTYPLTRLALIETLAGDVNSRTLDLMSVFGVHPYEMLAVYPFERGLPGGFFLVESAGERLTVVKMQDGMHVFRMNTDIDLYEPLKSIGNQAIFVGHRNCLSVDVDKFPSIDANCIYYLKSLDRPRDIYKYDLKDEKEERVSGAINSLNCTFLFDAKPPFTMIQLLSSYTINAWDSELHAQIRFEGFPEGAMFSAYVEEYEFDD